MSRQLAELLLKDKLITAAQFAEAQEAAGGGKSFARFLIEKKYVAEIKLLDYLRSRFGLPTINLSKFEVSPDVLKMMPPDVARKYGAIPIQANKGTLVVAICDPTNLVKLEDLKFSTKLNIEAVLTSFSMFDASFSKYYGGVANLGTAIEHFKKDQLKEVQTNDFKIENFEVHDIDGGSGDSDAPVISLVNGVLAEAIARGASDIHVEPYEHRFRVRMRIDGTLVEVAQIPGEMKRAVIARFKIMSRMDIGESRVPQDGRIKLKASGLEVDFRVNTVPTLFGEKVVLRLLRKDALQLDLGKVGFDAKQLETFKKGIYAANGMVLVTGPTGSGKTTTLYSALVELNKITDNLSTVEDPVEYNMEGINQIQINKDIGLTFANVLRSLLRQDPDIILVGEIRDYETAEVAVQGALTGHLVLSTLHTNDATGTVLRLMNMGVEPFLVVASLNTVVAQRLVRTICPQCKEEQSVPPEKLVAVGFPEYEVSKARCFKGRGCARCNMTGYKGRSAIFEVFDFSPTLKEMVLGGVTAMELKKQAIAEGMRNLRQSALAKVAEGKTSLEEALSVTMET